MALGNFDGVHRGHQQLIEAVVARARASGLKAVVMTFSPHPNQVLNKETPLLLATDAQKERLIAALGVDEIIFQPFSQDMAAMAPETFIQWLCQRLAPKILGVGFNFTFGRYGAGTPDLLAQWSEPFDYDLIVLPPVTVNGEIVSSTAIREALLSGDMARASEFLGHPPLIAGKVVAGDGRGRTLGIPTANISLPPGLLAPGNGVYAVRVRVQDMCYRGVMNIGVKPTFGSQPMRTVEVFLLDYRDNAYGLEVEVELLAFLRAERRFASPQALVQQINDDIRRAQAFF